MPTSVFQTFEEQLAYFRNKIPLPNDTLAGIESEYHDWALSVTGVTRADLIEDFYWLLDQAMSNGLTFEDFNRSFYRLIGRKGWTPLPMPERGTPAQQEKALQKNNRRLYVILDTNHRRSFGAGRIRQMRSPDLLKSRPYWQWLHRDSPHPRPHHLALDGKVFHAEEEFWDHAFPPNGFLCRCGVRSLSEADMQRRGLTVSTPPDWRSFVEPGFERSPGVSPLSDRLEYLERGIARQSPKMQSIMRERISKGNK